MPDVSSHGLGPDGGFRNTTQARGAKREENNIHAVPTFKPRPISQDLAARLARALGIHPVTAQVLAGRGVADEDAARRFLQPGPDHLRDPRLLRDMDRATAQLARAIDAGKRIAVYGDYDVDGVSATAVLVTMLRFLGAEVRSFIPHRVEDGYGLNPAALTRLQDEGSDVVVTVDNGTTRAEEVAAAIERGLEVIITDHHEPGGALPPCPVVNPKRADASYPFPGLAGCGVAFKVGFALVQRLDRARDPAFKRLLPDLLALVAIGTVADVVPLVDENRSLVALGLQALTATRHPGLRALLAVSRCSNKPVRATDIAFRLGPRINAAGRLGSAALALELLLCDDAARATKLAAELDAGNRERQRLERLQSDEAFAQARGILEEGDVPALVLSQAGWHPGLIGIVAARVAETFRRPAALVTIDGDDARGSARCFGDVLLHEALEQCAAHLTTYGGHAKAAGFTLPARNLDAFRAAFLAAVAAQGGRDVGPRLVDAELPIDAITAPLAAEIESLQPFGAANREPVFCAYNVRAAGRARLTGAGDRHLAFYAASDRTSVRAVAFNQADRRELLAGPVDLAFVLRRGTGPEPVEIHIREIASADP